MPAIDPIFVPATVGKYTTGVVVACDPARLGGVVLRPVGNGDDGLIRVDGGKLRAALAQLDQSVERIEKERLDAASDGEADAQLADYKLADRCPPCRACGDSMHSTTNCPDPFRTQR